MNPYSECACKWGGTPADPVMIKPCIGHLEWMREKAADAVAAEREAHARYLYEIEEAIACEEWCRTKPREAMRRLAAHEHEIERLRAANLELEYRRTAYLSGKGYMIGNIERAVAAEREACAVIADSLGRETVAAIIRARKDLK